MTKLKKDQEILKSFKDISDSSWDKIIIESREQLSNPPLSNWKDGLGYTTYWRFVYSHAGVINSKLFKVEGPMNSLSYSFASQEAFNDVKDTFPKASQYLSSLYTMMYNTSDGWKESKLAPGVLFKSLFQNKESGLNGAEKGNDLFNFVRRKDITYGGNKQTYIFYIKFNNKKVFDFFKKYGDGRSGVTIIYQAGVDFDEKELEGVSKDELVPNEVKPVIELTPEEKLKNIQEKLNEAFPGLIDKDGKLDEKKLEEYKNNSQGKQNSTDLPADQKDQLSKLENEWNKDFSDLFNGAEDKGLTVANLAKLKDRLKKAESNFEACKDYTRELIGSLSNAGVEEGDIPEVPKYETRSFLFEVPPKGGN